MRARAIDSRRFALLLGCGIASSLLTSACSTTFWGSTHFSGGVPACRRHCEERGERFAAFVYVGNYSTSCVCGSSTDASVAAGAGLTPAVVGVAIQMQRAAQQSSQH